jgi:hypothetical protein
MPKDRPYIIVWHKHVGRALRWGYTLVCPVHGPYPSAARWRSERTARKAGEADLEEYEQMEYDQQRDAEEWLASPEADEGYEEWALDAGVIRPDQARGEP